MITVEDIRGMEFEETKRGYDEEAVDNFLDEIADQMEQLIRDNAKNLKALEDAEKELENLRSAAPAPVAAEPAAEPAAPAYEDATYFRDLQATVRETLISAQRIADETVGEARKKAQLMVSAAEEQANAIKAQSRQDAEAAKEEVAAMKATATEEVNALKAQSEQEMDVAKMELANVKTSAEDFRARFLKLVQEQMTALNADESLFAKAE